MTEKDIIDVIKRTWTNPFHLEDLVDLGDDVDSDGDIIPITCDTLVVKDGELYLADSCQMNDDETFDEDELFKFSELTEENKKACEFSLNYTIKCMEFDLGMAVQTKQ